jgi:uncharacterized integral membrane protein (TIGR00698 family)
MQASSSSRLPSLRGLSTATRLVPGLLMAGLLAVSALELAKIGWLAAHGISVLTLAIVLGVIAGNTVYPRYAAVGGAGVAFAKQWLLRTGIVLYGLRLTFHDIAQVGVAGLLIDALVLTSTFVLATWLGTRFLGLDRKTAMLIGAGSSICGAAAVMAAEPVVRGRCEQIAMAVATVVVFGTLGMFLYPALYGLVREFHLFSLSPTAYGIYTGSTVHEVAQVVAAGRAISQAAADTAVITKMVRVMMLAPFLMALSVYLAKTESGAAIEHGKHTSRVVIPWFAVGFVALTAFNSFDLLPHTLVAAAVNGDTAILAMAMAALGLTTHVSAIKTAGLKPLALAALLFAWLIIGGFGINAAVSSLLN